MICKAHCQPAKVALSTNSINFNAFACALVNTRVRSTLAGSKEDEEEPPPAPKLSSCSDLYGFFVTAEPNGHDELTDPPTVSRLPSRFWSSRFLKFAYEFGGGIASSCTNHGLSLSHILPATIFLYTGFCITLATHFVTSFSTVVKSTVHVHGFSSSSK